MGKLRSSTTSNSSILSSHQTMDGYAYTASCEYMYA